MGLFKRRTKADKLNQKYQKLLKEAHALSTSNRSASDAKYAEAQAVLDEIDALKKDAANLK